MCSNIIFSQENASRHSLLIGTPLSFSMTSINTQNFNVKISSKYFTNLGLQFDYRYAISSMSSFEIGYNLQKYKIGFNYSITNENYIAPNNSDDYEKFSFTTFGIPIKYCIQLLENKTVSLYGKIGYRFTIPLIISSEYTGAELYDDSSDTYIEYLQRSYYPPNTHVISGEFGIAKTIHKRTLYYSFFLNYGLQKKEFGFYRFYPNFENESYGTIISRGSSIGFALSYIIQNIRYEK